MNVRYKILKVLLWLGLDWDQEKKLCRFYNGRINAEGGRRSPRQMARIFTKLQLSYHLDSAHAQGLRSQVSL